MMDWSNKSFIDSYTTYDKIYISSDSVEKTMRGLQDLKGRYPEIKAYTYEMATKDSQKIMTQTWGIFIIVIGAIIIATVIGILNVFYNNINSRRKEYAILRALNLSRIGVVKIILTQLTVYITIGSLLGLIIGSIVSNLTRETFEVVKINLFYPILVYLIILVFSIVVFTPFSIYISKKKIVNELDL